MTKLTPLSVEVTEGVKRSIPPRMIPVDLLSEWQAEHQSSNNGLFVSIYQYQTYDPYEGGVIGPFYMDFDNEADPDKARVEAIKVVKQLVKWGITEDSIDLAFSGMKGISLTVPPQVFNAECLDGLPQIWKSIAQELVSTLGLETVDTAIYDRRRLFRLINSKHQKSGLYTIVDVRTRTHGYSRYQKDRSETQR